MKKLCIIGGMGPLATANCYKRIIELSPAKSDQEHIETLVVSDSLIPDRTTCIISGEKDHLLDRLKRDFEIGNIWGADFFIIPCNTCHYYMDKIKTMTDKKILNMVELAVKAAKNSVYVFGTEGTRMSGIYKNEIIRTGRKYLDLDDSESQILMNTIYGIKEGIEPKLDNFPKIRDLIDKKINSGASIIIACTEMSLLDFNRDLIIDAMDEMVKEVIKEAYSV